MKITEAGLRQIIRSTLIEAQSNKKNSSKISSLLKLDPWTFDQTDRGWRSLPQDEQINALRAYLTTDDPRAGKNKEIPKGKLLDPTSITWHLAQALALRDHDGQGNITDRDEAVRWMRQSMNPADPQWCSYVSATIAFLQGDRAAFDKHRRGENYNGATLNRLAQGWGKPYRDVY